MMLNWDSCQLYVLATVQLLLPVVSWLLNTSSVLRWVSTVCQALFWALWVQSGRGVVPALGVRVWERQAPSHQGACDQVRRSLGEDHTWACRGRRSEPNRVWLRRWVQLWKVDSKYLNNNCSWDSPAACWEFSQSPCWIKMARFLLASELGLGYAHVQGGWESAVHFPSQKEHCAPQFSAFCSRFGPSDVQRLRQPGLPHGRWVTLFLLSSLRPILGSNEHTQVSQAGSASLLWPVRKVDPSSQIWEHAEVPPLSCLAPWLPASCITGGCRCGRPCTRADAPGFLGPP